MRNKLSHCSGLNDGNVRIENRNSKINVHEHVDLHESDVIITNYCLSSAASMCCLFKVPTICFCHKGCIITYKLLSDHISA